VSFCGDEAFDYDQSWSGKGQFLFSITGDDTGERGFEIDGSEAPSLNPKTVPVFSNITQIGAGLSSGVANNDAFRMKADGSGEFYNSIWTEFTGAFIRLDDTVTYERFEAGDIVFSNNVMYNFGKGGNDLDGILDIRAKDPALFAQHLVDNSNKIADPQLRGISWSQDQLLDPRPANGASILTGSQPLADDFFTNVPFIGAFGAVNWADGWTALTEYDIFGDLMVTGAEYLQNASGLRLNMINPVHEVGRFTLELPQVSEVDLQVFDLSGRQISRSALGNVSKGLSSHSFDVSTLIPGIYVALIRTNTGNVSSKFVLN
jgi:hypothetical protein